VRNPRVVLAPTLGCLSWLLGWTPRELAPRLQRSGAAFASRSRSFFQEDLTLVSPLLPCRFHAALPRTGFDSLQRPIAQLAARRRMVVRARVSRAKVLGQGAGRASSMLLDPQGPVASSRLPSESRACQSLLALQHNRPAGFRRGGVGSRRGDPEGPAPVRHSDQGTLTAFVRLKVPAVQ